MGLRAEIYECVYANCKLPFCAPLRAANLWLKSAAPRRRLQYPKPLWTTKVHTPSITLLLDKQSIR